LETWLFEMPARPIACSSSSTRRVETPPIQASRITVASAFSAVFAAPGTAGSTTPGALPGDHLSLTRAPGSKYWGIPPDARSPQNFHHDRGR
jgi:hypothetical protein